MQVTRIKCNQCSASFINEVPYHENGCSNSDQTWVIEPILGACYAIPENESSEFYEYETPPNDCYKYEDN